MTAHPSDPNSYYNDMLTKQTNPTKLVLINSLVFYQLLFLLRISIFEIAYTSLQQNGKFQIGFCLAYSGAFTLFVTYLALLRNSFNNWISNISLFVFEMGLLVFLIIGTVLGFKGREELGLESYQQL